MIQRALASLLCLLGAAAIALGIASATAWRADDVLVASAEAAPGTTMVVTEPGVLDMAAGSVTVTARGDSRVVIALGRTADVDAWVGGDAHTRVTGLAEWHVLATTDVDAEPEPSPTEPAPTEPAPTETAAAAETPAPTETPALPAEDAAEEPAPDPSGSDLWVSQVSADDRVEFEWTAREGRWSVLVASVGEDAGPPTVSLAWPQVVTTPWLWPGVVVGSLLLLAGLAWWARLLLAGRRGRRAGVARAVVATPAPVAAGAPAVPAGPLTRRQLREMEEQRTRGGRAARGAGERFPVVVPGPVRDTAAPAEPSAPATPSMPPIESPRPLTPSAAAPAAPDQHGRRTRRDAVPADADATTVIPRLTDGPTAGTAPEVPSTPGAVGPTEGRGRRFGLPGRLRREGTHASAPEVPTPEPPAAADPVVPAATQWTPAASADAWRRAWGLPAASDQQAEAVDPARPGPTGPAAPGAPAAPTQPDERHGRRRRDNR